MVATGNAARGLVTQTPSITSNVSTPLGRAWLTRTDTSAFAVRWLIRDQIDGKPVLNPDPGKGEVKAPLLLWGPYLWADGTTPRKIDGLGWERDDLVDRDGTHPSESGRKKVAGLLLKFFTEDPVAKTWFVKK